jgi:thiosulfate dehydrogenase [quinone] large subunit
LPALLRDTPGGSLIVLRAFLGVTFAYAGLQKLTNRFFFDAANPGSIQAQIHATMGTSPIGPLLRLAVHAPVLLGLVIAVGELAVGLGTLVGLYGRAAAAGGMTLSLMLFLSVSFNTSPYFYGSDIVFLFAWTPLVIAGSGAWSADAALAQRHAQDRAKAKKAPGQPAPELERRAAMRKLAAAVTLGTFALFAAGIASAIGRAFGSSSTQGNATGTLAPPVTGTGATSASGDKSSSGGTAIGLASEVPVGSAREFTDPAQGIPAFVVRPSTDSFLGFSAVCTHAGCTVGFYQPELQFRCPCHGSIYSALTGDVVRGPAVQPLPHIPIAKSASGELLADG